MADADDSIPSSPSSDAPASPTAASPKSPKPVAVINPAAYNLDEREQAALAARTPLTVVTYNVNSLRTLTRRLNVPDLATLFSILRADVICMQETKASAFADLPVALLRVPGYDSFWAFDVVNKGRNGIVTYARHGITCAVQTGLGFNSEEEEAQAAGVDWTAEEGRVVQTDHSAFVLFNIYFPNAGRGDDRLKYKLRFYAAVEERVRQLQAQGRQVVVVGDVNTAHRPIDIHNPKVKGSGFLPVEREWLDKVLLPELPTRAGIEVVTEESKADEEAVDSGDEAVEAAPTPTDAPVGEPLLVDVWRWLHPGRVQYSFWDQKTFARAKNRGWRIDFILATPQLAPHILHAAQHPEMQASDHSPVAVYFDAEVARQASSGGSGGVRVVGKNKAIDGRAAKGLEEVEKGKRGGGSKLVRDEKQKSLASFFGGGKPATPLAAAAAATDGSHAEELKESEMEQSAEAEVVAEHVSEETVSGKSKRKAKSTPAARKKSKK